MHPLRHCQYAIRSQSALCQARGYSLLDAAPAPPRSSWSHQRWDHHLPGRIQHQLWSLVNPGAWLYSIQSVGDLLFGDINQWRVFYWSNGGFPDRILSGMDALLYGEYLCLGREVFGGYLHAERSGKRPGNTAKTPRKCSEALHLYDISAKTLRKHSE